MTALTSPKGPLPARVYWFRRLMVLSVVFLLVFGLARLLNSSSDASSGAEQATTVSARVETTPTGEGTPSTSGTSEAPSPTATPAAKAKKKRKKKPLPAPTGTCLNEDVLVTPKVDEKRTSTKVGIDLVLRTKTTEACTWEVSSTSVTIKIDSGPRKSPDDIWQSRHCPKAVPTEEVTVYRDHDTVVPMTWNGRRSDDECSNTTDWARLGWYHVKAAAYAGEPTEVQFQLVRPAPVTVTRTVDPKPQDKKKNKRNRPSPKPSGAVEPNG